MRALRKWNQRRWQVRALALACGLSIVACERQRDLGAQCADAGCKPSGLTAAEDACAVFTSGAYGPLPMADRGCMPPLDGVPRPRRADGTIPCELAFELAPAEEDAGAGSGCDDPLFEGALPHAESRNGGVLCRLRQLPVAGNSPRVPEGTGWYYDDFSGDCPDPEFRLTNVAVGPHFVGMLLRCADAYAQPPAAPEDPPSAVDPAQCKAPPAQESVAGVGASCELRLAIDPRLDPRVRIETPHDQCESQLCLLYASADVWPDCNDNGQICAPAEDLAPYCSCRCGGASTDAEPLCACPDGFSCVPALDFGPDGLRGDYCVRNGTFYPELQP